MQVELVTDAVRLSECTAGWDALADELHQPRAGGSMVTAWARHMMDPSSELRIWLATEGSQAIGVLPFVAEPLPRGRQRLLPPAATFLYGITPIARPDRERAAAEALVGELARASAALDIVGVDCMPPRSPWAEAITGALNGPEWVALDPVRHNLPYVDLQEGLDGWLSRRQSKFKRELRRRARIQEAEGFRLFCTAEPEEIINRLPAVRALYNERQRERGGTGYRFDVTMVEAIEEALDLSSPGRISLITIERDDTVMAMQIELRSGHRTSGWMTGFDAAWGRLGPGKAVLAGAIAASAEGGDSIFDLGGGDELYKTDFVDGAFPLEDQIWCNPRMARLLRPRSVDTPPDEPDHSDEAADHR